MSENESKSEMRRAWYTQDNKAFLEKQMQKIEELGRKNAELENKIEKASWALWKCGGIALSLTNGKTEYEGDGYGAILKFIRETLAEIEGSE